MKIYHHLMSTFLWKTKKKNEDKLGNKSLLFRHLFFVLFCLSQSDTQSNFCWHPSDLRREKTKNSDRSMHISVCLSLWLWNVRGGDSPQVSHFFYLNFFISFCLFCLYLSFFFFLLLFGCFRLDIFFMLLLRAKRVKLRVFSKCTQQLLAPGSYIWKEIRGFPLSHEKKKNLFPPKMFLFWQEKERTSRSGSNHHTEYHR